MALRMHKQLHNCRLGRPQPFVAHSGNLRASSSLSSPLPSSTSSQRGPASASLTQRQSRPTLPRTTTSALSTPIMAMNASNSKNLLVVGPGVLGSYAGKLWKDTHPTAIITGVTNTQSNHERLVKLGLKPIEKDKLPAGDRYPYVLFSAPPSGSDDYAHEVAIALSLWDSTAPGACFVFTSSMGICSVDDGSVVTEHCPLVAEGAGPSSDKLLTAEKLVIKAGGNVLRLVGLYHAQRGAHTYFLKVKQVARPGDYVVNLLHYEDAARLAVAVLAGEGSGPFSGQVFMGCDNHPVKFKDMMDACLRSPLFAGQDPVQWTVPDQGPNKSKRADNSATRQQLGGWQPKYTSFESFMDQNGGKDFYNTSGLF